MFDFYAVVYFVKRLKSVTHYTAKVRLKISTHGQYGKGQKGEGEVKVFTHSQCSRGETEMFNTMRVRLKVFILGHYSKGEANKNSIQG